MRKGGVAAAVGATPSPKLPVRMRSARRRSTSTSAVIISLWIGKRWVSASFSPISNTAAWPSQARSVVLSPGPEAEKT